MMYPKPLQITETLPSCSCLADSHPFFTPCTDAPHPAPSLARPPRVDWTHHPWAFRPPMYSNHGLPQSPTFTRLLVFPPHQTLRFSRGEMMP